MRTANTKPDKVTSIFKTVGAGVFLCVPVLWVFGMMAKDHPVPADVQGCYKNGQQALQVQGTPIIVNGNPVPEVNVRYMNTNVGRQIETVNGTWLELDQDQPPHKQVGRNMIIRVQDNALVALTRDAEANHSRGYRLSRHATLSAIGSARLESRHSAFLPNHDICEWIAGVQNRSFAKMNQRPKLGSEGRSVSVRLWVLSALAAGQFRPHADVQVRNLRH